VVNLTISNLFNTFRNRARVYTSVFFRLGMETRLRQAAKMEAVGHLAGGMAHEFNNILAAMMMNVSLAQMLKPAADLAETLQELQALAQRAAGLIKQLLAYSRQSVLRPQPLDLATVLTRQAAGWRELLGPGVDLQLPPAKGCPLWVNADGALIEQVLRQFCLNARDAMPQGGSLRISLDPVELEADQAKLNDEARAGKQVCLTVADTGCGMDQRTLGRVFDPFFTTKDVGQGTGLGLATVHGIVQQHHGWVTVESVPGRGSTFRVYLPAWDPPVPSAPRSRPEAAAPARGTILMVEDESALRTVTRALLVHTGYRVLEAGDAREALALWQKHRGEIDLLFTDMVMPGDLSGLDLAQRIRADRPDLKVIIISGYNTEAAGLSQGSEASMIYLAKPCPPERLIRVIGECSPPGQPR